jgi:hypothetical protein
MNMWKSSFVEENIRIKPCSRTYFYSENRKTILINTVLHVMIIVDNSLHSSIFLHNAGMLRLCQQQIDTVEYW